MKAIVIDANALMAALGWRNEPYLCLVAIARRKARAVVTGEIVEECQRVARRMDEKKRFPRSPWPLLDWFLSTSRHVAPAPLGKQVSRDASDDPYLAAALAARAEFIITRDPDLLTLRKPFGVEILTPRAFLSRLHFGQFATKASQPNKPFARLKSHE